MASGTFNLSDEGTKSLCTKIVIIGLIGLVVIAAIVVGVIAFKTAPDDDECPSPKLDQNGLSNFSTGAKVIAMGCFPGFFLDQSTTDESGLVISKCIDKKWIPEPPECNYLPLRIDCVVERDGLRGFVTMMQMDAKNETKIIGLIKYKDAINPKGEGHLNEIIQVSRQSPNCKPNTNYNLSKEIDEIGDIEDPYYLKVGFESSSLAAYRKAEVHLNMIFLDVNNTVNLISVHQGKLVLVMPTKMPSFKAYHKLKALKGFDQILENSADEEEQDSNEVTSNEVPTGAES